MDYKTTPKSNTNIIIIILLSVIGALISIAGLIAIYIFCCIEENQELFKTKSKLQFNALPHGKKSDPGPEDRKRLLICYFEH